MQLVEGNQIMLDGERDIRYSAEQTNRNQARSEWLGHAEM